MLTSAEKPENRNGKLGLQAGVLKDFNLKALGCQVQGVRMLSDILGL